MKDSYRKQKIMKFREFFDCKNLEHVKAFIYLQGHGTWPEGFIPEDCEMEPSWYVDTCIEAANIFMRDFADREEREEKVNENKEWIYKQ